MSYRSRDVESTMLLPATTYGQAPPRPRLSRLPSEKSSIGSKRLSMASNSSAGRRSSASFDSVSGPVSTRPTGIPRPTKTSASVRLNSSTASNHPTTTLGLPARSKVSTHVPTITPRKMAQNHPTPGKLSLNNAPRIVTDDDVVNLDTHSLPLGIDHEAVFDIVPSSKSILRDNSLPPRLIPELQALAAVSQRRPTPAVSTISTVSSPSSLMTISPSPWSASTTATTPTSWPSTSPCLVQPARLQNTAKRSQTVPIASISRTKFPKLPILTEATTSIVTPSSLPSQSEEISTPKKLRKRTPINSPAPTPPPRSSSIKRNRSRSNSRGEDADHRNLVDVPPLPTELDPDPIIASFAEASLRQKKETGASISMNHHQKLQEAISYVPHVVLNQGDVGPSHAEIDFEDRKAHDQNWNQRKLLDAANVETVNEVKARPSLQRTRSNAQEPSIQSPGSRSRLAKFSKLALFGRSSKAASSEEVPDQHARKLLRKGPVAGTGHEGYGKFRRKDRRMSNDGNTTGTESETSSTSVYQAPLRIGSGRDRSRSTRTDRSSQSDLEDFVATRLKPRAILGGSQRGRSTSKAIPVNQSQTQLEPPSQIDNVDNLHIAQEIQHPGIASSGPLMRESRLIFHLDSLDAQDRPQNHSGLNGIPETMYDHVSQFNTDFPTLPVPPYSLDHNTSQSSITPPSIALTDASSDFGKMESQSTDKQRKKGRRLNWGFFKRKEFVPEKYFPRSSSRTAGFAMPVQVTEVPPQRQVPYYAVLESENDVSNTEMAGNSPIRIPEASQMSETDDVVSPAEDYEDVSVQRATSVLLPAGPVLSRGLSDVNYTTSSGPPMHIPVMSVPSTKIQARQPRLAQVGRIPKVIPTPQSTLPAQDSLLQPPQPELTSRTTSSSRRAALPRKTAQAIPTSSTSSGQGLLDLQANASNRYPPQTGLEQLQPVNYVSSRDYQRYPDRYSTTSSSSDGVISVMGPPLLPLPDLPRHRARHTMTTEEDIWNEYDDFIDHVVSNPRLKKSSAQTRDVVRQRPLAAPRQSIPLDGTVEIHKAVQSLTLDTSLTPPSLFFTSPISIGDYDVDHDFHLRRSRIISALHSSMDPASPFSIGEYLVELGEPRRDSDRISGLSNDRTTGQHGERSPAQVFVFPEPPATRTEFKSYENAVHMDELERSQNPVKHSERSYASLMVSRWLSFGRVLFSPAHAEIQKLPERHVLVIDGLGNEDWSIYCAVTYQSEQAYIYDLKETGHTPSPSSPSKGTTSAPPNFRRREIRSFNEVFKFPDNFFSVIVLRFPPVMAESKMRNMVSECRRVLAPGGYLELMLLDLDIVNMGVVTRRAMRAVKTKIAMCNRDVSLKPVIDNIQSVLGEKGFSKLSKCVVGVPVVGKPVGADSPTSSRSSGASDWYKQSPTAGPRPFEGLAGQRHHNFSLNDLVADHSDNADAKIGRVVSRTARSWWQHCFETAIISDGNLSKSIFADRQVLSECKSRASSFKLLIAYTQKPALSAISIKRRTMSEPVVATLATAGIS